MGALCQNFRAGANAVLTSCSGPALALELELASDPLLVPIGPLSEEPTTWASSSRFWSQIQ